MKLKKLKMKVPVTVLSIFAVTIVIELLSLHIQPGNFADTLTDIVTRPLLIPLNVLPVLALVLVGYFVSGNVFWGSAPVALVLSLLSYVNLLKIEGRDDAFVPADIGLFREALGAASDYSLDMHIPLVLIIILLTALLVCLGFVLKSASPRPLIRIPIAVLTLVAFMLTVKFVYSDKKLYESFPVEQMYNIPFVFNTLGFNYCFLYNLNLYPVDKPADYSVSEVEEWCKQYLAEKNTDADMPNIIMVMGEAFSDISNNEVFDWETPESNPAHKFNLLCESDRSLSGHIVVSNIAAGTANTEFDIMTGTPTNTLSDATTSSFRVVHRDIPTLATVYRNSGADTYFMHPGSNWFYNRNSVYKHFGINDLVFSEAFDLEKDIRGSFVSDAAFLRQLKSDIASYGDSPFFMYTVTLQNHQTYNYAKYDEHPDPVPLNTEISDAAMEYLSTYLTGVRDTADAVFQLAEYIDTLSRPTLLVFFGDHLPNLGENFLTYRELGIDVGNTDNPESIINSYKTPFVIYANTAYCENTDIKADFEALSMSETVNDIYLGAAVLELADLEGHDPYFDYLNTARRTLPVFRSRENAYMLPDGSYTSTLTDPACLDIIDTLDKWQYYRIKG